MNDQQRAAMQMALEALEEAVAGMGGSYAIWSITGKEAITALREALVQPQGEWVDLTDDEIEEVCVGLWAGYWSYSRWIPLAQTFIAKFKEKNTPPSVEAMRIETLEKAIDVCRGWTTGGPQDEYQNGWNNALAKAMQEIAAIRSMG